MTEKPTGVAWSVDSGLATITMARGHGNAIDGQLVEGLASAFREAEVDPTVRGALLTSAGKIFCPGLDLQELMDHDRPAMAAFMRGFGQCLSSLYSFPKPLVAAISGHALAGGCILALTADWSVLRRGALVGLNEVRVGVPLPFGVAEILRASVHPNRLEEVALLGRNYSDEDAVATGLVHELHEADGFQEHCRARLEEFASKDLAALATTKRYLRLGTLEGIARGECFLDEFLDCWFSEGTRARIQEIVQDLKSRSK